MATNTETSDRESVVMDNDEGTTNDESSRSRPPIKSTIIISKNHPLGPIEKNVQGCFVTVNQLKHFGFIKRKSETPSPNVFAREASILDKVRPKKFFVGDKCRFDLIKTLRGYEAINIDILERNINSINKLGKIPMKKKDTEPKQTEISNDLFQSTLAMLFREAINKKKRAKSQKIARQNNEFKAQDNERRAEAYKIERQSDEFKTQENERRAEALKIERQDDEFRREENKRREEALKIARLDNEFKEEEKRKNALRMYNSRDKYKNNFDAMKSNYESNIKQGPTHICSCCDGLWFAYSIREYTIDMLANKGLKTEFINTVCYLKHAIIKLCATCRKDIMSNKIPNIALSNGLTFCEIPDCLKTLTELEERLISPRIPFMVIRTLGFSKQFGLKEYNIELQDKALSSPVYYLEEIENTDPPLNKEIERNDENLIIDNKQDSPEEITNVTQIFQGEPMSTDPQISHKRKADQLVDE
ncbi:unnamed protein product [Adineta steineri]|uniref:DUF6570 domain-containing protein n=1 Tax=Adineta steineri TaxID=433720 RepID=A0A815RE64_9BILA|nr:unnamed protein product [Adineta steineri]CAF1636686.1 unnamed protein product [Adineta steineri]